MTYNVDAGIQATIDEKNGPLKIKKTLKNVKKT